MIYDYTICKKKQKRIQNQECIQLDNDRTICKIDNKECTAIEKSVDTLGMIRSSLANRLILKNSKIIESKKNYNRKKKYKEDICD